MKDIELVIKIPECFYEYCKSQKDATEIQLAVAKGKPLPKGHGQLIDISDIEPMSYTVDGGDYYDDYKAIDWEDIENAPIIIEAESEEV